MMSHNKIDPKIFEMLKAVVLKHRPDLLPIVDSLGNNPLSFNLREELREAIADEFCESGLNESDEPNEFGLRLEELIDLLGHL